MDKIDIEKGILLAKTECRGLNLFTSEAGDMAVSGFEIAVARTGELERLVELIGDEDSEQRVYMMLEEDLAEEAKDFIGGLNVLINENNTENVPVGGIGISVECYLTEKNSIDIEVGYTMDELLENLPDDDRERLLIQVLGHQKMFQSYYSAPFRENWEAFIGYIFNEPDKFKVFLQDQF